MKATGIVRRIDELGRVGIPKEIRRTLRIREGDPLEIFTDRDGGVILKKYSPIGELGGFAKEYAEALYKTMNHITLICDRDAYIAVMGAGKKEYIDKMVSKDVEHVMEQRQPYVCDKQQGIPAVPLTKEEEGGKDYCYQVIVPVVSEGEVIGAVIIASKQADAHFSDTELKVAQIAAGFLGKQMD